jgi:hypothetical protein
MLHWIHLAVFAFEDPVKIALIGSSRVCLALSHPSIGMYLHLTKHWVTWTCPESAKSHSAQKGPKSGNYLLHNFLGNPSLSLIAHELAESI